MELTRYVSPLGTIFLAADNGALAGLWLEGQKYFAATLDEAMHIAEELLGDPNASVNAIPDGVSVMVIPKENAE